MQEAVEALSHKDYLTINKDYEQTASSAGLRYVNDRLPGINRLKKGKGFFYVLSNGKPVKDPKTLERIRKLVLPPAWTRVWICLQEDGHIQATGFDIRNRKQYRYHARWNSLRSETKFHRLYEFGKALPALREKIESDFRQKGLTQDKVLATVIGLMERTYIRVGSNEYEKANGSYGLTTLKDQQVSIKGDTINFSFVGKKGVHHDITLRNRRLARTVAQCRDIPGKELFQYYDETGQRRPIDSGMVNEYIKQAMHTDFSTKDFRTWAGSVHALQAFRSIGEAESVTDCRKKLAGMFDLVSGRLGNTRTVCKKYYVHPGLVTLYEDHQLVKYLKELDTLEGKTEDPGQFSEGGEYKGLTPEEQVLMKIVRKSMVV